jgi:hypothetical protein
MKYAHIKNNVAIDVIQTDPFMVFVPSYAQQFEEVDESCCVGMVLEDGVWVSPPVITPVPQEVTMRQARLALLDAGLLSSVQTAINSLQEPAKTKAQIEWDYSNALQRDNSFVATLGAALGLNDAALDSLFIAASKL